MIETTEAGTMIAGADVDGFFYISLVGRLAMQARGTKFRGISPMMQAKSYSGSEKRTTLGVLEDYISWLYANGVRLVNVEQTVLRALGPERSKKLGKRLIKEARQRENGRKIAAYG